MPMNLPDRRAPAFHRAPVDRSRDVLVVDDDPGVRELLAEFLRRMQLKVASASNGRAAITAIEREPDRYWLVLSDLDMPGANGLDVLSAVKAINPALHVVIISGYGSLDMAVNAVRLGAFDYLSKPFTLGEIEMLIHRLGQRLELERGQRRLRGHAGTDRLDERVLGRIGEIAARLDRLEPILESLSSTGFRLR